MTSQYWPQVLWSKASPSNSACQAEFRISKFASSCDRTPTYHLGLVCQARQQNIVARSAHRFFASLKQEITEFHLANETQISSILFLQHALPEGVEFGLPVWVNDSQCSSVKLLQERLPHFTKCWLLR